MKIVVQNLQKRSGLASSLVDEYDPDVLLAQEIALYSEDPKRFDDKDHAASNVYEYVGYGTAIYTKAASALSNVRKVDSPYAEIGGFVRKKTTIATYSSNGKRRSRSHTAAADTSARAPRQRHDEDTTTPAPTTTAGANQSTAAAATCASRPDKDDPITEKNSPAGGEAGEHETSIEDDDDDMEDDNNNPNVQEKVEEGEGKDNEGDEDSCPHGIIDIDDEIEFVSFHGYNGQPFKKVYKLIAHVRAVVARLSRDNSGCAVFAGDFNTWTQEHIDAVTEELKRCGFVHVKSWRYPDRFGAKNLFLDHLFVRGRDVQVRNLRIYGNQSDHRGIVFELVRARSPPLTIPTPTAATTMTTTTTKRQRTS